MTSPPPFSWWASGWISTPSPSWPSIRRVTDKVGPGSIVLFHNAALHTPEALPTILQTLLQEGYTFVPISQLLLTGEYTIDHTGRQCPA